MRDDENAEKMTEKASITESSDLRSYAIGFCLIFWICVVIAIM